MKFFEILDGIKEANKDDTIVKSNGAMLLDNNGRLFPRHKLFRPLNDFTMRLCFAFYNQKVPESYLKLLKYTNGAELCTVTVWFTIQRKNKTERSANGLGGLSILGLPLKIQTPQTSSEQPKERIEEPSNALSENMFRRHEDLPERWFKVAYYTPIDTDLMLSVYVDPDDDKTYAFDDFATEPYRTWDSLDECLCSIYEELKDGPAEKEFKRK